MADTALLAGYPRYVRTYLPLIIYIPREPHPNIPIHDKPWGRCTHRLPAPDVHVLRSLYRRQTTGPKGGLSMKSREQSSLLVFIYSITWSKSDGTFHTAIKYISFLLLECKNINSRSRVVLGFRAFNGKCRLFSINTKVVNITTGSLTQNSNICEQAFMKYTSTGKCFQSKLICNILQHLGFFITFSSDKILFQIPPFCVIDTASIWSHPLVTTFAYKLYCILRHLSVPWVSNYITHDTVISNYSSMPWIPAFGPPISHMHLSSLSTCNIISHPLKPSQLICWIER